MKTSRLLEKQGRRMKHPQSKGGEYERLIGRKLSDWLSYGQRDDLFSRNVLSGGQFTASAARGKARGNSGDVVSSHPSVYWFTHRYTIECKHYRDLDFLGFLLGTPSSYLNTFIAKLEAGAEVDGKTWLLIARQNRKSDVVLYPPASIPICEPEHLLFGGKVGMMQLSRLLALPPDFFLQRQGRERVRLKGGDEWK